MKAWELDKSLRLQVKKHIAEHWREYSDAEIGTRFGLSRVYIANTRARMGLIKRLPVLRGMRDTIRWVEKTKRSQSQNRPHRKLTDLEKYDKAQARKHKNTEDESNAPLSESEHNAYMRSLGYILD